MSNQPPTLQDYDAYSHDAALRQAVGRASADWDEGRLHRVGTAVGDPKWMALAEAANRHPPELQTHDRRGDRLDVVAFHPAYHELLTFACRERLHNGPWFEAGGGAHAARAAGTLLYSQIETGTQCPLTMTYAAIPVLQRHAEANPAIGAEWLPRLLSPEYDPRFAPIDHKRGAMIGMGMTERQGGSDVRANLTTATPLRQREPGQPYRIDGHKWFMSAPMADAFLILAQAPGGLSCFLLPRFVDRTVNPLHFVRLKDKLGNRSNASSEVEFHAATGFLLGEEGRGVPTIIEMVNYTRLDCALGSAATMRQALVQALHHASHRTTFGKRLLAHPLMRNVLTDLALESEAATMLALRLAQTYDADAGSSDAALRRVLTPAAKYWICKRLAPFTQEAMEVVGGNGYVETSVLPRLYREAPLNSIWEGSGNVMCLDVQRALARDTAAREALETSLDDALGADSRLDDYIARTRAAMATDLSDDTDARRRTQMIALAVQGAELMRHAPECVADAFFASRLAGDGGRAFGTLDNSTQFDALVARAWPPAAARV